jgi:hypothetical protein
MKIRWQPVLQNIKRFLWVLFLVSLPFTNFRYFPGKLGGLKLQVKPMLIIPLVGLLPLALVGLWKRKLPRFYQPLIVFFLLTLVSSVLPLVSGYESQLAEVTILSRFIRTMITLLMGLAIYFVVSLTPANKQDLDFSLRWLYGGLILALFWGTLQAIYVLDIIPGWYVFMSKIQTHITINVGSPDRVMGFTLEPSWFADQITALWLPWVLAAAIRNKTVFGKRWGWITVEKFLLVWMLGILMFTLSRAGLAVAVVVLASGFLLFRARRDHQEQSSPRKEWWGSLSNIYFRIPRVVRVTVLSTVGITAIAFVVYSISKDNKYINRMWQYWLNYSSLADTTGSRSLGDFFRYIGFGPRFVYWVTAFRIFQDYPIFGVGLGNYAFHFMNHIPAVQVGYMPELLTRLVPDYVRVTTAKNYLGRLLAETGILGVGSYLTFILTLVYGGGYLWLQQDPDRKFWGAAALLAVIAFLVDSFSYDSLAIPNPWVVFGLITAAFNVYTSQGNNEESLL